MKAVICTKYGPPEVLQFKEIAKPVPKDNEILVKIQATTCHIGDVRIRSFDVPLLQRIPFRLFLGIRKPKRSILGMEFSGDVESVGNEIKKFKKGDKVFASTGFIFGSYAEYICVKEESENVRKGFVALKPEKMSYQEAAAGITTGGITALHVLKKANIQKGQKVLIYGASGSVGTFAVQLAKYYGADVTGVCSTVNFQTVKSLGADELIDYTKEDFAKTDTTYDVIFDAVDKLSYSKVKKSLTEKGVFLNVNKDSGSGAGIGSKDLLFLKKLVEAGRLKTVIDRSYTFDQIIEAHKYVEKGHKKGHVVINFM